MRLVCADHANASQCDTPALVRAVDEQMHNAPPHMKPCDTPALVRAMDEHNGHVACRVPLAACDAPCAIGAGPDAKAAGVPSTTCHLPSASRIAEVNN